MTYSVCLVLLDRVTGSSGVLSGAVVLDMLSWSVLPVPPCVQAFVEGEALEKLLSCPSLRFVVAKESCFLHRIHEGNSSDSFTKCWD